MQVNLRGIANGISRTINANQEVTLLQSNGFTMGAGARQIPQYLPPVTLYAQIQALDSVDLKQLDGLNIQGTIRAIYITGALAGVIRPNQVGGDLIQWNGQDWLVVKVLESWTGWTKAAIVLQGGV